MNTLRFGSLAVAGLFSLALSAGPAEAASQLLGDSGWRVHFGSGLNIRFDGVTNDRAEVKIEKIAQFTDPFDRGVGPTLEVTFEQVSFDAVPFISVEAESVLNQTGSNWAGFNFSLTEATNGAGTNVKFDETKTFGDDDPFKIDPFTTFDFNSELTNLEVGGGSLANGDVWLPGSGNGAGELVIFAAPVSSGTKRAFFFKEQPIIPLPAAAWTGLVSLVGLGVVSYGKRVRRLISE